MGKLYLGTQEICPLIYDLETVPTGLPKEVDGDGIYGPPVSGTINFSLPSTARDVADYTFYYAFEDSPAINSADFSSLTDVSGNRAFYNAFNTSSITSVDFSGLVYVNGSYAFYFAFSDCFSLVSVDLSSLTELLAQRAMCGCFSGCGITSINLSSLTTISGQLAAAQMFDYCEDLASVDLSSLAVVDGNGAMQAMFRGCESLTTLSFPSLTANSFGAYTNQFRNMLDGVTGCTVHFPAAIQSTIGSWSDVTNGFSGTNTTVLFDL